MALEIEDTPVPLNSGVDGVVRVGGTRVTLDIVIAAFGRGATAEEIVQKYPSLNLADVYAVLGYYLHHRPQVDAYLRRREEQASEIRRQIEADFDPTGIRERLLARRRNTES